MPPHRRVPPRRRKPDAGHSRLGQAYQADSLWNYELGFKSQWFDRKLTFNADAYRIDWTNMQTSVTATYGNFSYISNVGARIEGFEMKLSGTPTKGLFLNGSVAAVYPRLTQIRSAPKSPPRAAWATS
jgi:outer membrane receptor protein involved in Fe transport